MPYAPGASPYRAKGNIYRTLFESTDARCPGGARAVMGRLETPELRAFFEQPFVAGGLYDMLPIVAWGEIAARLAGMPYFVYVREGGRVAANRDIHGIYRALLKLATPQMVCSRLPRAHVQYYTFGNVEGAFTGANRYEMTLRQWPGQLATWLHGVTEGFNTVALETAGAKNVKIHSVVHTTHETDGEIELVDGSSVITWE